jgi:Potential Queuosine, Q, salvage protein family
MSEQRPSATAEADPQATATISQEQVAAVATTLRHKFGGSRPQPAKWDNPLFWNVDASRADRCQFLAVGNAINFRFWSLADGHVVASAGRVDGEFFRGAMYMWRRLRVAICRGEFGVDAEWLSTLTDAAFARAFEDDDGACPLIPGLAARAENLRDLGARLLVRWQGKFVNVVDAAQGSLSRFADMSATFRAFDDPVRKLTMVNAIMLAGSGLAHFDEEPLPGIDYHLVKQAVRQGLVVPSGRIQDKLRERRYLTPSESLALREATLVALLQVADASETSTAVIDNVYWLNGRVCDERAPACRECPFEKVCLQRVDLGRPLEPTRYY